MFCVCGGQPLLQQRGNHFHVHDTDDSATRAGLLALVLASPRAALARPAYVAAPIAVNTTTYLHELDAGASIVGDYDAVTIDWSSYGV